ncbi:MAG: response regulator [Thaumarchaeota archaeon]|nr:response regulator [Nitrososphaerota archaeon]
MSRIMIADDSESTRIALKNIILDSNHELVAEAVDGLDAVEKFHSLSPDVLLLDIAMPKKDGLITLQELKRTTPQAKVIMITASDDLKAIEDCMSAGALAYIIKPFEQNNVLQTISFALEDN